jgi:site-specific recombinase XerD
MATIYKRKGIWWIQYYYKGKRTQRSLHTMDQEEAKGELEWQKTKLVLAQKEERPSEITPEKYIELYMTKWSRPRKSRRTHEYDQSNLDRYPKHFARELSKITPAQLSDYIQYRTQHCGISTVNRELGFIKAFSNKAVEWGYLSRSPAAGLKAFKQRPRVPRFFSKREVDPLLDKA